MQKSEIGSSEYREQIPKNLSFWLIGIDEPPKCDLYTLASVGDHENLQKKIKREVDNITKKNLYSWTPLMYACFSGCEKSVQILIDNGATKNDRNTKDQTALMIAASYGNCQVFHHFSEKELLEQEDGKGWTALFYAVAARQKAAAQMLLTSGSCINKTDKKGLSVSMIAAMDENIAMLELLLSMGSNPIIRSSEGSSTISIVISKRNIHLLEVLERYWIKEKNSDFRKEVVDQMGTLQSQNQEENKPSTFICPASQISFSELQKLDLDMLLRQYDLAKYYPIFQEQNVTLSIFLNLTEEDLKRMGIKLFGPRRKMSLLINHWIGCDMCKNLCGGL